MIPYTSHPGASGSTPSNPSASDGNLERIRRNEQKMQLENRIRIMKNDVVSKKRIEQEDFRREHELDHFTARTEEGHAREKGVRVQLLEQEQKRKETEMNHKKQQISEIKRQLIDKEQDIMQLEAQLRRVVSGA